MKMSSYAMITVLELVLLAAVVCASVVERSYNSYSTPVCPINAVCSEIYYIPSQGYVNYEMCKCPTGLYCPTEPGAQSMSVDENRWYGLCRSVDELKRCQHDDVAEEIMVGARNFGDRTYTKILCTCPLHESDQISSGQAATLWAGTTTDSSEAKTIYHLMCSEDSLTKRGGRFSKSGGRKFYFYKRR